MVAVGRRVSDLLRTGNARATIVVWSSLLLLGTGGTLSAPVLVRSDPGAGPLGLEFRHFPTRALGELPQGSVPDRVASETSDPLNLSISAARDGTDVGLPFAMSAEVSGGDPPYEVTWSDSLGDEGSGPTWSIAPAVTGNLTVAAFAFDAAGAIATSSRVVESVAPPRATLADLSQSPGAGGTFLLRGTITGGVAPYAAELTVTPGAFNATVTVAASGGFFASVVAPPAGNATAQLQLTDAAGASGFASTPLVAVPIPPLDLVAGVSSAHVDAGVPVHLLLAISGGVPPVSYAIDSASPILNESAAGGPVGSNGSVSWVGSFPSPGNVTLYVSARDGAGRSAATDVFIRVAPELVAFLTVATGHPLSDGTLGLSTTVAGGTPPYAWVLSSSGGAAAAGNLTLAGTVNLTLPASAPGAVVLRLQVLDSLGDAAYAQANATIGGVGPDPVPLPPAGADPSPLGTAVDAVVAFGLCGAILGAVVLLRRRRSEPEGPPGADAPHALTEVRRLLKGAEALDRDTLTFLAEEAGISRSEAEQALARWSRAGHVRLDRDPSGAETFHWVERPDGGEELEELP